MDRLQQIFDIIAKDGFADKVLQEINLQKGTVPDVKIERDSYEARNQKRPW